MCTRLQLAVRLMLLASVCQWLQCSHCIAAAVFGKAVQLQHSLSVAAAWLTCSLVWGALSFRSTGRLILRLDSPSRLVVLMKQTCSGSRKACQQQLKK